MIIVQPRPLPGSLHGQLAPLRTILVWLSAFVSVANIEGFPGQLSKVGQIFISRWQYIFVVFCRVQDFIGNFECLFRSPDLEH